MEEVGAVLESASEALVVSVIPLDGSHNRIAVVETARYGRKTVVCGAPNCEVGVCTVYLPVGVKTIEGIESDGMLASAAELGISRDHAGIVELNSSFTLRPDHIIEVDNKSLTHRPDLWGHHGMAREVAAIVGRKLLDPVRGDLPAGAGAIRVTVEDYDLCPRYSALVFENVTIRPSPLWLQYRLEAIGLNPISNIVDVTNFVMAELAQPMHAFDADKLRGGKIIVRQARVGERLAALNGESYDLDPTNLVIADSENAVALAGVIGGAESAISDSTTRIVLESACFQCIVGAQDFVGAEAADGCFDAIREIAGSAQYGARVEAGAGIVERSFARDSSWWAASSTRIVRWPSLPRSSCRSIGWTGSWGGRFRQRKCGGFSNRWNFAWMK